MTEHRQTAAEYFARVMQIENARALQADPVAYWDGAELRDLIEEVTNGR